MPEIQIQEYRRISLDGEIYYGKHLILTARSCNQNLTEIPRVELFMKMLVDKIDMVAFGEPIVARFGQGIEVERTCLS